MRQVKWCGAVVLAAWLCVGAADAAIIANYQGDWLPGAVNGQTRPAVAADGWDYMWNSAGVIGNAANYTSLMWWSGSNHYNRDGAGNLPRSDPGAYVSLHATGGHPGRGSTQTGGGNNIDRYAIGAYTVQPGEGGALSLNNSSIAVPGSGNVELRVYINNNLMGTIVRPGGGAASAFDRLLGWVNPGDRVFVAVGPNGTDGSDSFNMGYRLETGADANVVVWDADGVGPIDGGAGGWDAASARWVANAGAGGYTSWTNNSTALFAVTGGNVTLDAPATARGVVFSADGYALSGANALTLTNAGSGGAGPAILAVTYAGHTATISAPILASTSVTRLDAGTLILQGNTAITGNLNIGGGNTVLAGNSATNVTGTVRVGLSQVSSGIFGTFGGTLTIQDNATLTTTSVYMGENSGNYPGLVPIINQTGGTVTVSNHVRVGHWPVHTSTYNMSGGALTITGTSATNPFGGSEQAGALYLGIDGVGIFNHSNGVVSAQGLVLDNRGDTGGTDTYTMTGGVLNLGQWGIQGNASTLVNLGGGTVRATANFTSSRPITLTGTGGNVTFDTNGFSIGLNQPLTGAGGLNKVGAGTLSLNNAGNNFGGLTNIQGGILNALAGNFTGSVTVGPAGGLHAGQGVIRSPLAIGGSYTQSGTLYLEVASPSSFDWLQVAGTADLGGTIDITFTQPVSLPPGAYFDVIVAQSGILNAGSVNFNISGPYDGPVLWSRLVELGGTAQALQLYASPEPSSLALLALGGLALVRRRRGRRTA